MVVGYINKIITDMDPEVNVPYSQNDCNNLKKIVSAVIEQGHVTENWVFA